MLQKIRNRRMVASTIILDDHDKSAVSFCVGNSQKSKKSMQKGEFGS